MRSGGNVERVATTPDSATGPQDVAHLVQASEADSSAAGACPLRPPDTRVADGPTCLKKRTTSLRLLAAGPVSALCTRQLPC
jgi:hypothetical protein